MKRAFAPIAISVLTLSGCAGAPVTGSPTAPSSTPPAAPSAAPPVLFSRQVMVPVPGDPGAVSTGDFNQDGKLDLITANDDGTVTVLLGTGTGVFNGMPDIAGGNGPVSMAVADLNGDGRLDIVLAYSGVSDSGTGADEMVVLLANADGTFKRLTRPSGVNAQDLAIGDFNGDNKPDLATADEGVNVSIFMGVGAGTFKDPANFPSGGPFSSGVSVADFNGDGKLDVATANSLIGRGRSDRTVSVLLGRGDGSFDAPLVAPVGGAQPIMPVAADLNGDGFPDVVTPNGDPSHEVSVLLGVGDGHLGESIQYRTGADPHSAIIADLDADGHPDIAAWDSGVGGGLVDRGLSILFGTGGRNLWREHRRDGDL